MSPPIQDLSITGFRRSAGATFQQYNWDATKKATLQAFIEKIHAHWPIDRDYMAPPTVGELARLDPALLVTPPRGMEVGYVPIVTRQEAASR